MVTASSRPLSELSHAGATTSPFFNIFSELILGLLEPAAAQALRRAPFEQQGITLTLEHETLIEELAGRHPYLLQLACYQLFAVLAEPGERDWAEEVRTRFGEQARPQLEGLWAGLSDQQRSVSISLAQRRPPTSDAQDALSRLERLGVVERRADGTWSLFSAYFAEWVRSRSSVEEPVSEGPERAKAAPPEPTAIQPPELGLYGEPGGPQGRFEEVMAGLSSGEEGGPGRTLTALVKYRTDGRALLLLAGRPLSPGIGVRQPAPSYGGGRRDQIGVVLDQVVNERCMGAVARLDGERPFLSMLPDGSPVGGVAAPGLDMQVCKYGAETGYTRGTIVQADVSVSLQIDENRRQVIHHGFLVSEPDFSAPGDIGALVLSADGQRAVGVVVAHLGESEVRVDGRPLTGQMTACMAIQPVLDELGVELVPGRVRYRSTQQATERIVASTDQVGGVDRLGFESYVKAFVRLIQDTQPPLTIGMYGAWGTGKSFLMDQIARKLKPEGDVKEVEKLSLRQKIFRLSRTKTPIVWFDAWDYNASEKLWAGLVERIFLSIENSGLGWYGQLRINLKRNLERQWRVLRSRLLPYTLIAIVVAALTAGFVLTNQEAWATAVGGSTALVLVISLVRQLAGVFGTSASQRIVDLFATPDYTADIGFMGRIRQDLEDFADSLPEGMKVVVFIDDLDRCDPKKSVEVLEAIKLLLDFERFIVFLALDARVITQAIEEHYGKVLAEAEITGYEYLDKIVQIPFSIPEPRPKDLRNYIGSLVGLAEAEVPLLEMLALRATEAEEALQPPEFVAEPVPPTPAPGQAPPPTVSEAPPIEKAEPAAPTEQVTEAPDEGPAVEDVLDTAVVTFTRAEQEAILNFYDFLDPNPRRIKRVVNIYRLVRALIASQGQGGEAISAGVLESPGRILGWLILCEQWPYAAHVMLEELDRRTRGTEPDLEPVSTLVELGQIAQERIEREGDEALKKLDLRYEQLGQFMGTHLSDFSVEDVGHLRPYTVNFNPALSAEVRLSLAKES
jgi:hypothetical protein